MLSLAGAALLMLPGLPVAAQVVGCESTDPYLFILFDTSGSMNLAPPCSPADLSAGACSRLCTGAECYVPLQADSPDSKFFQVKAGLYDALSSVEAESVFFGFATFNQDALYARSKHWLYEAASNGVSIPGWGPFPAAGAREVLGRGWSCDEGSGDNEVGCLPTNPADLSDAWEHERVRMLAKGGEGVTTPVTVFLRSAGAVYRVRYMPVAGGALGGPLSLKVRVERCQTSTCSSVINLGEPTVPYTEISEYLAWDNNASRTEPIGYFSQAGAADASATNTCSGWEPNTDSVADRFNGYSLHWPTTGDPRGTFFDRGDVLPLDWFADHRQEIQQRLAPNVALDPFAAPDFRTSPYLQDVRFGAESFLRPKNENARPLVATGSTPHGGALRSFRAWYAGCVSGSCPGSGWLGQAAAQDPSFYCRPRNVLLITDGVDTCGASNPCTDAAVLFSQYGVRTFVVAYGMDSPAPSVLSCMAQNGHTELQLPRNPGELSQVLREIFVEAAQQP